MLWSTSLKTAFHLGLFLIITSVESKCSGSNSEIACPCGQTGLTFTIHCTDELDATEDPCAKFEFCETCQDGLPRCLSCQQGHLGPYCSKGTNAYLHLANETENYLRARLQRSRRPVRAVDCPDLPGPKLGSIRCWYSRRERECTGGCLPGHHFQDSEAEEIVLRCVSRRWEPRSSFPPCVSEGHCDLEMAGAGYYNCTTGSQGTRCDVRCNGHPRQSGRFFCFPGRNWEPPLPHCVRSKGLQTDRQNCRCQNGGSCDIDTGSCACPDNYHGRYCEQFAYPVRARCANPRQVANGFITDSEGRTPIPERPQEGTTVVYACRNGYALHGASLLTCGSDGTWSAQPPTCRRIQTTTTTTTVAYPVRARCPNPRQVTNGFITDSEGRTPIPERPQEGTTIVYACRNGFALNGASLLTCGSDGTWSAPPPTCMRIQTITTTTTTTARPEVRKATCPDPGFITNGLRLRADGRNSPRQRTFDEEMSVVYSCRQGFALHGVSLMTCLGNGRWSQALPECKSVVAPAVTTENQIAYCKDPGVDPNGKKSAHPWLDPRTNTDQVDPEYPEGMRFVYSCKLGYVLRGEATITCLFTGQWSHPTPTCSSATRTGDVGDLAYCKDPGYIADGARMVIYPLNERRRQKPASPDESEYPEGVEIEYSCKGGYELFGDSTIACTRTGSWSGTLPECRTGCGTSSIGDVRRIVHGQKTTAGQWPWQVAIADIRRNQPYINCGAVLINRRTVLTAAHCVTEKSLDKLRLYFGKHFFSDEKDDDKVSRRKPSSITIHPAYDEDTLDADIAIVRFAPEVKFSSRISPVCLPTAATTKKNVKEGQKGWIAGWGLNERGVNPEFLMMAEIPVVSTSVCQKAYREQKLEFPITENMFCGGYREKKVDSCIGDSGGPFIFYDSEKHRFTLEGIVSFGVEDGCGAGDKYTVYTKVGNLLRWIKANS